MTWGYNFQVKLWLKVTIAIDFWAVYKINCVQQVFPFSYTKKLSTYTVIKTDSLN